MRSHTWVHLLWRAVRDGIVQDVPSDLDACESCRVPDCDGKRRLVCISLHPRAAQATESEGTNHPG
ncbi:MAG: hypothetical protein ABSB49_17510 [Polyangia bacterium]